MIDLSACFITLTDYENVVSLHHISDFPHVLRRSEHRKVRRRLRRGKVRVGVDVQQSVVPQLQLPRPRSSVPVWQHLKSKTKQMNGILNKGYTAVCCGLALLGCGVLHGEQREAITPGESVSTRDNNNESPHDAPRQLRYR